MATAKAPLIVPSVFGESFFDNAFLHDPVSILHPFIICKWFLYTYISMPALHAHAYISAYTSIIIALHMFYRFLGYHMYLPLLYFVIIPPTIIIFKGTLLYTYNTYMHHIYTNISCTSVIHCNTQALIPPPKFKS